MLSQREFGYWLVLGVLLQVKKDYVLQIGAVPGDIMFQYTTVRQVPRHFEQKGRLIS